MQALLLLENVFDATITVTVATAQTQTRVLVQQDGGGGLKASTDPGLPKRVRGYF